MFESLVKSSPEVLFHSYNQYCAWFLCDSAIEVNWIPERKSPLTAKAWKNVYFPAKQGRISLHFKKKPSTGLQYGILPLCISVFFQSKSQKNFLSRSLLYCPLFPAMLTTLGVIKNDTVLRLNGMEQNCYWHMSPKAATGLRSVLYSGSKLQD